MNWMRALCVGLLASAWALSARAQVAPPQSAELGESVRSSASRAKSRGARAELATVQALVGAAVGAEVCWIADCRSPRAWAGSVLLGTGGGLTLSLLTTRDGIAPGRAQAVNTGTLFGSWLGIASTAVVRDPNGPTVAGFLIAGQLLGAGLGLLADDVYELTPGEVGLAGSGAIWSGFVSALTVVAIDPQGDDEHVRRRFLGSTLVVTSLGLVGGAWLARREQMSRGRAFLIDGGAVAGAGLLPLLAWLIRGQDVKPAALCGASIAGALAGLTTGFLLTRHWDAPNAPPLSMSIVPARGGAVAELRLAL